MDRTSMFSITTKVRGETRTHEVKALQIIWAKFPQFSAKNTIHVIDDRDLDCHVMVMVMMMQLSSL